MKSLHYRAIILLLTLGACLGRGTALAANPAFDCGQAAPGSIEEMICKDDGLAALDRRLAAVYRSALKKAANERPPVLRVEQRGWTKGRNDCWKSEDKRSCVEEAYKLRIAELQARYRLVPGKGPVRYVCDGDPNNEVLATFFQTDPPTLDRRTGGPGLADVFAAERQRHPLSGPQRVPLGAPGRGPDHLGLWQPRRCAAGLTGKLCWRSIGGRPGLRERQFWWPQGSG